MGSFLFINHLTHLASGMVGATPFLEAGNLWPAMIHTTAMQRFCSAPYGTLQACPAKGVTF